MARQYGYIPGHYIIIQCRPITLKSKHAICKLEDLATILQSIRGLQINWTRRHQNDTGVRQTTFRLNRTRRQHVNCPSHNLSERIIVESRIYNFSCNSHETPAMRAEPWEPSHESRATKSEPQNLSQQSQAIKPEPQELNHENQATNLSQKTKP